MARRRDSFVPIGKIFSDRDCESELQLPLDFAKTPRAEDR